MRPALRHLRYVAKPMAAVAILRDRLQLRRSRSFLAAAKGVIHVGAGHADERDDYAAHDLPVIWIEAFPDNFAKAQQNLATYPKQVCYQHLVLDRDGTPVTFHISSNEGRSSSVFDFDQHGDIWPDVVFDRDITLRSATLPAIFREHDINSARYDTLVLDTQGSELLILSGAASLLPGFRTIKVEVADFPSYAGGALLPDMNSFMKKHGFRPWSQVRFAERAQGGTYFDIIYKR